MIASALSMACIIIIASLLGTGYIEKSKEMLSTKVSRINHNCQIENVSIDMAHDFIRLSINSKTKANVTSYKTNRKGTEECLNDEANY